MGDKVITPRFHVGWILPHGGHPGCAGSLDRLPQKCPQGVVLLAEKLRVGPRKCWTHSNLVIEDSMDMLDEVNGGWFETLVVNGCKNRGSLGFCHSEKMISNICIPHVTIVIDSFGMITSVD